MEDGFIQGLFLVCLVQRDITSQPPAIWIKAVINAHLARLQQILSSEIAIHVPQAALQQELATQSASHAVQDLTVKRAPQPVSHALLGTVVLVEWIRSHVQPAASVVQGLAAASCVTQAVLQVSTVC